MNIKESGGGEESIDKEVDDEDCELDELESSVCEEQLELGIVLGVEKEKEDGEEAVEDDEEGNTIENDKGAVAGDEFMSQSLLKRA